MRACGTAGDLAAAECCRRQNREVLSVTVQQRGWCVTHNKNLYFTITTVATYKAMKKALRGAQTLRAGCSKAEPNIFAPPQTPFPGRGTAKI